MKTELIQTLIDQRTEAFHKAELAANNGKNDQSKAFSELACALSMAIDGHQMNDRRDIENEWRMKMADAN